MFGKRNFIDSGIFCEIIRPPEIANGGVNILASAQNLRPHAEHLGPRERRACGIYGFAISPAHIGEKGGSRGVASMSHWPLLQSIQNMDGFELTMFVVWSIILFLAIGYAFDYALAPSGMGPYWNAAYAALGAYSGLCAHDRWFLSFSPYEPELTIYMALAGLMTTLMGATAIAMRR